MKSIAIFAVVVVLLMIVAYKSRRVKCPFCGSKETSFDDERNVFYCLRSECGRVFTDKELSR
jgi:hypothetical protein